MAKQVFLDQDGNPNMVDDVNHDAALQHGLEPAFEMVDPQGEKHYVRKSNYDVATKSGLKFPHEVAAENEADTRYRKELENTKISPVESAARGFANAATFGSADEIQAAVKNPLGAVKSLGGLFGKDNSGDKDVAAYARARNDYRASDDASYAQNPWSQRAGNVISGLAGGLAGAPGGIAQAAKTGAALGGIAGVGSGSDEGQGADLTKGDIGRLLMQTGIGAVTGGITGAAGQKVAQDIVPKTKDLAEKFAYRATGGLKSDINKIYGGTPNDVGRVLLDEGVVTAGSKRGGDTIKQNIQDTLGKYAGKQDEFLQGLDASGAEGVRPADVQAKMQSKIDFLNAMPGRDNKKAASAMQAELDDFLETVKGSSTQPNNPMNVTPNQQNPIGPSKQLTGEVNGNQSTEMPNNISLEDALGMKRGYDSGGKFQNKTEAASVQAAREARKSLKDSIDEAIGRSTDQESLAGYKADRMKSKNLMDALNAVDQSQQRQTANKIFGLTDAAVGGAGAGAALMSHSPGTGLAAAGLLGAKKIGETFGDSTSAVILNKANQWISQFGLDEGMKKINQTLGPEIGQEVMRQLQNKFSSQGRE